MEFLVIAILILSNGILAMSEIALVCVKKPALSSEAKKGSVYAKNALKLASSPDRFFSTVQIGITLIGILTGIYSGETISANFGNLLASLGIPSSAALFLAQAAIVIIVTYLTLIFGELVPKRIGLAAPEKIAKIIASPMLLLSKIAAPFVYILSKSSTFVLKVLGINSADRKITEAEIKSMVREGVKSGEVQSIERNILERVFLLGDRHVESIMTPRNEIVKIDISSSRRQVEDIVKQNPHSVYPVSNGSLDEILGFVYIEDLFAELTKQSPSLKNILKPVEYFKEDTMVYSALEILRKRRVKNAIISNEFGVTLGIVTLNDVLDAVLGDMPERNEEEYIVACGENKFAVTGQCPFHDFMIFFELEDSGETYNTVSGLILDKLQHIPHVGERIKWRDLRIKVAEMDGVRINRILVERPEQPEQN